MNSEKRIYNLYSEQFIKKPKKEKNFWIKRLTFFWAKNRTKTVLGSCFGRKEKNREWEPSVRFLLSEHGRSQIWSVGGYSLAALAVRGRGEG